MVQGPKSCDNMAHIVSGSVGLFVVIFQGCKWDVHVHMYDAETETRPILRSDETEMFEWRYRDEDETFEPWLYNFNCTLCSEKNTHSHFLSYLHEWCV